MRRPGECSPSYIRSTLRVLHLQHVRRMEKLTWRWGLGSKGTSRGWGEKQTKCFNSCPLFFFLHLFCPRIWFPSEGVGFLWAKGSAQQGLFTLRSRILLLRRRMGWWEENGIFYRVHIKAKPARENAVHLNFKQRLATNEEKKNLTCFLLNFWQENCSSGKMECHSHVTSFFTAVPWWCRRHVNWERLDK